MGLLFDFIIYLFIYLQIFSALHKLFLPLLPFLSVLFLTFPLRLVLKLISLPLSSLINSYCSFPLQFLPTDPSVSSSPLTYPLFLFSSFLV